MEYCVCVQFTIAAEDEAGAKQAVHELLAETGAIYDIEYAERDA